MKLNRTAINKVATEKSISIESSLTDLEALNLLTNSNGVSLSKSELVSIGLSSGDSWDSLFTIDSFTPQSFEVSEKEGKNGKFSVFKSINKEGKVLSLKESQYFAMLANGLKTQYFHLVSISEGRYKAEDDNLLPFISFKFDITTSATSSQEVVYKSETKAFTEVEIETIRGQKSFNAGLEHLTRKGINVAELVTLGLMENVNVPTRLKGETVTAYKARTGNKAMTAEMFKTLPVA